MATWYAGGAVEAVEEGGFLSSGDTPEQGYGFPIPGASDHIIFFFHATWDNGHNLRWYVLRRYGTDLGIELVGDLDVTSLYPEQRGGEYAVRGAITPLEPGYGILPLTGSKGVPVAWDTDGARFGTVYDTEIDVSFPDVTEPGSHTILPHPGVGFLSMSTSRNTGNGHAGFDGWVTKFFLDKTALTVSALSTTQHLYGYSSPNGQLETLRGDGSYMEVGYTPYGGSFRGGQYEVPSVQWRPASDPRLYVPRLGSGLVIADTDPYTVARHELSWNVDTASASGTPPFRGARQELVQHLPGLVGASLICITTYGNQSGSEKHDWRVVYLDDPNDSAMTATAPDVGAMSKFAYKARPRLAEAFDGTALVLPGGASVDTPRDADGYAVYDRSYNVHQHDWNGAQQSLVQSWGLGTSKVVNYYSGVEGYDVSGEVATPARMEEKVTVVAWGQRYSDGFTFPLRRKFQLYYKQGVEIPTLLIPRKGWAEPSRVELERYLVEEGVPEEERERWLDGVERWSEMRGLAEYEDYLDIEQWAAQLQRDNP